MTAFLLRVVALSICLNFAEFGHKFSSFTKHSQKLDNNSVLENALTSLLVHFLTKEAYITNVINVELPGDFEVHDFRNELLVLCSKDLKTIFRNEFSDRIVNLKKRRRISNLIIVQNFDQFLQVYKKISSDQFWFNGIYIVAILNGQILEIAEIFNLFWKIQIYNVFLLYQNLDSTVSVQSFDPFRFQKCNTSTAVVVNKFVDGIFVNKFQLYNRNMKNLHGCPIRVSLSSSSRPFVLVKKNESGVTTLTGEDIQLLKTLAESLNFEIDVKFVGREGYIFENGTASGPLKALLDGDVDFSISNWWLKTNRLNFFDTSTSYASDSLVFIIPPSWPYSSLENLVYPFTALLWTAVMLCFSIGALVIFIVSRQSRSVKSFIFGIGVNQPYLNMFAAFIGGSQVKSPTKNFSRFLLMNFLIYSLVLRSVYQGSSYEFLQSNKHETKIKSISEMIDKDFRFFVSESVEDMYQGSDAIKSKYLFTFA